MIRIIESIIVVGACQGGGGRPSVWDFETDAAYQADLDWADHFVRREVEPLDQSSAFPTRSRIRNAKS